MPKSEQIIGLIIAGGKGERLRPLTAKRPKHLLPVLDRPLLEHIINALVSNGITELTITVNYGSDQIMEYFGDGHRFGVKLDYIKEDRILGTWGSIVNALNASKKLRDHSILAWVGDAFTSLNVSEALSFHKTKKCVATICLYKLDSPARMGMVSLDSDFLVTKYEENQCERGALVNAGVYIFEPDLLTWIPKINFPYAESELFPLFVQKKLLHGYVFEDYYVNINEPSDYLRANIIALRQFSQKECVHIKSRIDIGQTKLNGPLYIGPHCKFGSDCVVGPYVVIGSDCCLGDKCEVAYSAILDGSRVRSGSRLYRVIMDRDGTIIHIR